MLTLEQVKAIKWYRQSVAGVPLCITDEGGITSHAAIVSRELGLPCITGTQIASKSLSDGDIVGVDAIHGIIKIVKKAGA